jgi:hypothetical protein
MAVHFVRVVRYSETVDGTYGVMEYNGVPLGMTLEPNDRGNGANSRIPPGRYRCRRHNGPKYKNTWEIIEVPGRSAVLFHIGNIEDDSLGCVLLGSSLASVKGKLGVGSSGATFARFMELSEKAEELSLTITESF